MNSAQVESRSIEARLGRPSLLVQKLRDIGVIPLHIPEILKAIDSTCPYCWDADRKKCNCWKED